MTAYLTPREAAELLQVKKDHIYLWINSGRLPASDMSLHIGGRPRWRIKASDLDAFVESRQAPPPARPRRRKPKNIPKLI